VRALTPHIGAFLELEGGDPLAVLAAEAVPGTGLAAGELAVADGLLLGCAVGALRLRRVRPAGGRAMDADAYLRGHPLPRLA
jgi:methionyl-tRNA formyltransferase